MCLGIKCPCKSWIQCHKYNTNIWKSIHPEEFNIELHNWYDTIFRIKYEHGENIGNG